MIRIRLVATGLSLLLTSCAVATQAPATGNAPAFAPRTEWQVPSLPPPSPITAAEYAERRERLAAAMEEGVLVVFGSPWRPELSIVPPTQNAHFRYLTSILEPDAVLIIEKTGSRVREQLFVRPRDPVVESWVGRRLGPEDAGALTGLPTGTTPEFQPALDSLLAPHRTLYIATPLPPPLSAENMLSLEQQQLAAVLARHPGTQVVSLDHTIMQLRATKSERELDLIRRAVHVTALGHLETMRSVQPGMNEFEIQALVEYEFRRNGADGPAFPSIVGSGPNSTTLHYLERNRFMQDGDILLMDVGASYRGYAADITRTLPVNGQFSPEQGAIYGVVLAAQKAAEERVRPGTSWNEVVATASRVLAEGLAQLGLIDAPDAIFDCEVAGQIRRCPQLRLFYWHALGHGVGLDFHDPDIYLQEDSFQRGSVFTIEPGIYVRADAFDHLPDTTGNRAMVQRLSPALERYRNIGVRIEDVYFLTDTGAERISAGIPREIAEIEALMREEGLGMHNRRPDVLDWLRDPASSPRP